MSTPTTPTQAPSVMDLLRASAQPKAAAKSSTVPDLARPDLQSKTRRLQELIAQAKDIEAEKKSLAADLMAVLEPVRVTESMARGKALSSLKVNGLTYTCQNRYSEIANTDSAPTRINDLKLHFGQKFDGYFKEQYAIAIEVNQLTPELLQSLLAAGAAVTHSLKVTQQYHEDRTLKPEIAALSAAVPDIKPVAFFKD